MTQDVRDAVAETERRIATGFGAERPLRRKGRSATTSWRDTAERGLAGAVETGRDVYDRRRALPRLIALDPRELDADSPALDRSILVRLKRALRVERSRGRAGRWTYDLNRHLALLQALAGEGGRTGAAKVRRRATTAPAGADHPERRETKNAARSNGRRS